MSDPVPKPLPRGTVSPPLPPLVAEARSQGTDRPFLAGGFGAASPIGAARDSASEISALYRLTDRLYRADTPAAAYEAAFGAISELFGSSRAAILQFDETGVMRLVAWQGLSEAYREAVSSHSPWRPGEREAEPILIGDVAVAPEVEALRPVLEREDIHALAFIPLTSEEAVIGKFMVYYDAPVAFTVRERDLGLLISRQLSFSIQRFAADQASGRLAALVDSSDDAIMATDLCGTIRSWNSGAEALLGYRAEEIIGRPVTVLHPADRQGREASILARIRGGERLKSYETIRQRKDGSHVDISLTVSPILDRRGHVIGISKIARDISERRIAQAKQDLLLREVTHRIKNLFALANSLVSLSARTARTPEELARDVSKRLEALSNAHALTMQATGAAALEPVHPSLHALLDTILAPYGRQAAAPATNYVIAGVDALITPAAVTPIALIFHEFATNAAKYGALADPHGRIEIHCARRADRIHVLWTEIGGSRPPPEGQKEGFGSQLVQAAAQQLGSLRREWTPEGLTLELAVSNDHFDLSAGSHHGTPPGPAPQA